MVTGTITLDSTQILTRSIRINHAKINPESRYTHLRMGYPTFRMQLFSNGLFKWRIKKAAGRAYCFSQSGNASLRIFKKML